MKTISGNFNGTGANVYICIGFVPDFVELYNLEGTQYLAAKWNIEMMRAAEVSEGVQFSGAAVAGAALTAGAGILPYYGGDMLTTTLAGTTTYGEGVYLKRDKTDYRYLDKDASEADIDTWTLYSGYTGHFNSDVTGTYIGEGSEIWIDGKRYMIQLLTAGTGNATSEVTLSHTGVPSSKVEYIGGMYTYKPMVAAEVTPAGFVIKNTTINVNNALIGFVAGQYSQ